MKRSIICDCQLSKGMEWNGKRCWWSFYYSSSCFNYGILLFFLLMGFFFQFHFKLISLSTFESVVYKHTDDDIFESGATIGRNLLQVTKACSVNFELLNYTILTSQCKEPKYLPDLCCSALKEFACPYAEELIDPTNDCATRMFSYIDLRGNYPPGLFIAKCREWKEGLVCPAKPPTESANPNGSRIVCNLPSQLMLAAGFLVLSFQF